MVRAGYFSRKSKDAKRPRDSNKFIWTVKGLIYRRQLSLENKKKHGSPSTHWRGDGVFYRRFHLGTEYM